MGTAGRPPSAPNYFPRLHSHRMDLGATAPTLMTEPETCTEKERQRATMDHCGSGFLQVPSPIQYLRLDSGVTRGGQSTTFGRESHSSMKGAPPLSFRACFDPPSEMTQNGKEEEPLAVTLSAKLSAFCPSSYATGAK